MTDKKKNTALTTGLAAALISGFFATINLALRLTNPWIPVILYGITLIACLMIFFAFRSMIHEKKAIRNLLDDLLRIQDEISVIRHQTIRERQYKAMDSVFFRLNRGLLNSFKTAYVRYCMENSLPVDSNTEASEPVLAYRELLEQISVSNKLFLIEMVIEENHIDHLSVDEYESYKTDKLSLLKTNAVNIRNQRYRDDLFVIPLEELNRITGRETAEICHDEYQYLFNKFREITINENHLIGKKELEIETILEAL